VGHRRLSPMSRWSLAGAALGTPLLSRYFSQSRCLTDQQATFNRIDPLPQFSIHRRFPHLKPLGGNGLAMCLWWLRPSLEVSGTGIPPPGYSVTAMSVAAALNALRSEMRGREKKFWTIILFAFALIPTGRKGRGWSQRRLTICHDD